MRKQLKKVLAISVATLLVGALASTSPVDAATAKKGAKRTVTVTIKGGKGLTVLLVSGTGRTLASKKITKPTQKNLKLKTTNVSTTTGMNLQLIGADGEYFGPVVLGWKGSKSTSAKKVYTRLKSTNASKISLGTITVKTVGATKKQGYAVATKQVGLADKTARAAVKATRGKPNGVGTYGKSSVSAKSVKSNSVGDVSSLNVPQAPDPVQPGPVAPQPSTPASTPTADDTLGGDKDDDGIPNAFDVDDDGDGILDAADSSTPESVVR